MDKWNVLHKRIGKGAQTRGIAEEKQEIMTNYGGMRRHLAWPILVVLGFISNVLQVYCCIIRCISEYASAVWAALPGGLAEYVEKVQKTALRIIFPDHAYDEALVLCGLATLAERREIACMKFISKVHDTGFLVNLLPHCASVAHMYGLRSADSRPDI